MRVKRRTVFLGLGIVLLVLVSIKLGVQAYLNRVMNRNAVMRCPSNMSQIGKAIQIYAGECRGQFPDKLTTLMGPHAELTGEVFCCPYSFDEPVPHSDTIAERMAQIDAAGYPKDLHESRLPPETKRHCSYIYVGQGLTWPTDPNRVILYESLVNHDNHGINILFGDGHVEWQVRKDAEVTIRNLGK